MKSFLKHLVFLLVLIFPVSVSAGVMSDYIQAKNLYLAASACMAAYENRYGSLAVSGFEQEGWQVEPLKDSDEKAEVRYLLAWDTRSVSDRDVYLLAVAGTESFRDVKVDLRANKVYFAGKTLEEFEINAARKDLPPEAPRVHQGFNQVAQVLLMAQTAQAENRQDNTTRTLSAILQEDKEDKVFLVGHSLGGAVVTLVATRLIDMGVSVDQIKVISFGAPAVGNEEFQKKYDGKVPVTRITLKDDPVPIALRRIFGGYRHIGEKVEWAIPDSVKNYFSHDLPLYWDLALKNYYIKRRAALGAGIVFSEENTAETGAKIYVAAIKNDLPSDLQSEFPFMQEALWDEYERISPGFIKETAEHSFVDIREKAIAANCVFLVIPEIRAFRARQQNTWYISLAQTVYSVQEGDVIKMDIFGTNTKELTPLGALVNGARTMSRESKAWMNGKKYNMGQKEGEISAFEH